MLRLFGHVERMNESGFKKAICKRDVRYNAYVEGTLRENSTLVSLKKL